MNAVSRTRPISAEIPAPDSSSYPVLRKGAKGTWVRKMQLALDAAGFSPGTIDGDFGPKTKQAVERFQSSMGLKVDGVCGEQTWKALQGVASGQRGTTSTSGLPSGDTFEASSAGTPASMVLPDSSAPPVPTSYAEWPNDALLALDPLALSQDERDRYYDEIYKRAAAIYFTYVNGQRHDFSRIPDGDLKLLSSYAEKLGLAVNPNGRVWGTERERPIFTAVSDNLPRQGYDLAIDQWCITKPGDERYESGKPSENPRYRPADGKTRCDLFVRDVIHAMLGVVIPPRSANGIYDWLTSKDGRSNGWVEVDAATAQQMANDGHVVVAARRRSEEGSGHVQVIRPQNPSRDENPPLQPPVAAQAGKSAYGYDEASCGMSKGSIRYFYHP